MMAILAMAENHHTARFEASTLRPFSLLLLFSAIMTPTLTAQESEPVRYTVSFPSPQNHYASVKADFPTDGRPSIEIFMAVWMPGSYLIREYARNVEDFQGPSVVVKTTKNRWRIDTGGAARVRVTYRVCCRETRSAQIGWKIRLPC
jgi:hypothetical protein